MTDEKITRIMSLPTLSTTLPYYFSETGATIYNLTIRCGKCGRHIDAANIRGVFESRNMHSASLIAYALCYEDQTATKFVGRFAADGSYLVQSMVGWQKGRWAKDETSGFFAKLKRLLK